MTGHSTDAVVEISHGQIVYRIAGNDSDPRVSGQEVQQSCDRTS